MQSVNNGSFQTNRPLNLKRRRQPLAVRRPRVNLPHEFHAFGHATKCREALSVWIALATEIEFRLIANAN